MLMILLMIRQRRMHQTKKESSSGRIESFTANLKVCFDSSMPVVISLLLYGWTARTTSYANMSTFYEEKYFVETHVRGYIKSYQQLLNFIVQSFLVKTLLSKAKGERNAACIAAIILAAATLVEVHANFNVFIAIVCPLVAVSVGTIGLSLRSLVTQVTPKESIGSVLAALDVLQNAASVTVPFYRTLLFNLIAVLGSKDDNADMVGDPEPRVWLFSSFLHWSIFSVVIICLLLPTFSRGDEGTDKKNR